MILVVAAPGWGVNPNHIIFPSDWHDQSFLTESIFDPSLHLYNKDNDNWTCRRIFFVDCRLIKQMKTWKNNISRYSLLYLLTKVCSAQATSVREAPPIAPAFCLLTMLSCQNRARIPIKCYKIIEPCHTSWTLRYHLIGEVCELCFWMLLDLMWRGMSWS